MDRIREAVAELTRTFRAAGSMHEAHRAATPVMEQLTHQPAFLTAVLERYVADPRSLDRKNYPVVGVNIALNPWFALVANCWIPLPGRETHISTKAIHHHGNMLLTTATLFGPGYEHWMFSRPQRVAEGGAHTMDLLEVAPHPQHHVSFVDAWIAHTPFYPKDLSITLALWSSQFSTKWLDHVKRQRWLSKHAELPKKVATKLGLTRALDLKVVESYDFFPTRTGFEVMRERKEFDLGPTEDHLHSVFHIVQGTGNEHLARTIRRQVPHVKAGRETLERLLADLERGTPIEGRLSDGHHGIPYANFTRDDVFRALGAGERNDSGGKLASAPGGQAPPRAHAD